MKIGILTYHGVPNFGAQLQTVSTIGYLKRVGFEPIVINWYPQDLEDMYERRIPKAQITIHKSFVQSVMPLTELCRSEEELFGVIEHHNIDAIVVGSDALFKYKPDRLRRRFSKRRLKYVNQSVLSVEKLEGNPFFGDFAAQLERSIPVVAFSVSSQNCPYQIMSDTERKKMKFALDNYSNITVRDEWTKNMVEYITDRKNVLVTPDPVFSFNQNCYFKIPSKKDILQKYFLKEKYILLSFSNWYINENYIHQIASEAERRGFQPVAFPMPESLNAAGIRDRIELPLSPLDWYALIKYSSGYIGERMHPIVVCLHNVIPFFSFDEYGIYKRKCLGLKKEYVNDSSKTYHVLKEAGLENWLYSYKSKAFMPSPQIVMEKIDRFDKNRCEAFAVSQQKCYEESMNQAIVCLNRV